jgi:prophage regulatory protein
VAPTLPHRVVLGRDMPELTGFKETQLKQMVKDGNFPAPLRLGPRKLGWILAEVIAWQESKIAERDAPGGQIYTVPWLVPKSRQAATAAATPRWKPQE